jgi:DNA polymerase III delta subunit
VFRAAESSVEEILAAFQGTSLFSPRELSVVLEIEDLGRSEKRIRALAQGIAQPNEGSCLVLVESAAETPRKTLEPLRAACEARFAAFPPRRAELLQWGRHRLARAGLEFEPGVIEAVVDGCEGDALAFFGELEKLCSWGAGEGRPLSRDDVAALLRPVVGADLSGYLSAVASGEARSAAQRLGRVLAAGVGEGTVLFALSNLVSGALGGWARYRDLSLVLARRSKPHALGRALDALYRAEAAWKGGRADAVAVLEQATRVLSR